MVDYCAGLVCAEEVCVDGAIAPHPVDTPSPAPAANPVHALGVWLLVGGGVIAATALVVPLFVCPSQTTVDAYGQSHSTSGCSQVSDGVKIGWIAGGGIGLTLALVGGIVVTVSSSTPPPGAGREPVEEPHQRGAAGPVGSTGPCGRPAAARASASPSSVPGP